MIHYVSGDLVKDKKYNIFCHQVNCMGKMGKGIAKQIAEEYPEVYNAYMNEYNNRTFGLGNNLYVRTHDNRVCVSMYGQHDYGNEGIHTDYGAFASCLEKIEKKLNISSEHLYVGFPYMIGCGNGGGDWDIISTMLDVLAERVKQEIFIVKLEE